MRLNNKETPESLPPISRKISNERAELIAKTHGVTFDGDQFRIETQFATGEKVTHIVLGRETVNIKRADGTRLAIPIEKYIEAVKAIYPTVNKGSEADIKIEGSLAKEKS